MADITEAERVALENEIKGIFERLKEHVIADIEAMQQWVAGETVLSSWGQAIIERLKEEAVKELKDKIEDDIRNEVEVEVSKKAEKAVRGAIERILQIKGISISDFTPLERMELEWILNDFAL